MFEINHLPEELHIFLSVMALWLFKKTPGICPKIFQKKREVGM